MSVTASTNEDGSDPEEYDSAKLSEYKYIYAAEPTPEPGPAYFLVTVQTGEGGSVSCDYGATSDDGLLIPTIIGGKATFGIAAAEGYVIESVTVDGKAQDVTEGYAEWDGKVATAGGRLNIRALPDATATIVGKALSGAAIDVLSIEGEWANVRYGGLEGWAHTDYLTMT